MNPPLPIGLYCVWQWWEKHYQAEHGRPDRIDFDWLDATWLGRQRRLHEWFGDLGLGQAEPSMDTGFVAKHFGRLESVPLGDIERALDAGVNDLALWDADSAFSPAQLGTFLRELAGLARRHNREPQFGFIPFAWEELDWEFPQYHKENYKHH